MPISNRGWPCRHGQVCLGGYVRRRGDRPAVDRPRNGSRRLVRLALLCAVASLLASPSLRASAEPAPVEYKLKAAFVLNFGNLVEWPAAAFASDADPMIFCLAAADDVAAIFEQSFDDRTAQNRSVELRHIRRRDALPGCHILFVTATDPNPTQTWIDAAAGAPLLTIGEADAFTRRGGMIGFYADGTKIRFEINLQAAEDAGLRISSRLLRLARIVKSGSD